MDAVSKKIYNQTYNQADAGISVFLQIPQGDRLEIKIKESQYNFRLNETIIAQIQQAQKIGNTLYIPPSLLIQLWSYTCISHNVVPEEKYKIKKLNSSTKKQPLTIFYTILTFKILKVIFNKSFRQEIILQTEFTFNSYYTQEESAVTVKDEEPILQTTIFLNGDVFHKIKKDFLEKNFQFSDIISAHYWLSEQVLSYFQTNLNLLVWEVAAFVPAGLLAHNVFPTNWGLSIVTWVGATIGLIIIRSGLRGQLQKRTAIKSKYLDYLAWEIICLIPAIQVVTANGLQALLMMVLSPVLPLVSKRLLAFIWPQVGKLFIRGLLS
ncbi:hypothetical protein JYQ62_31295 [Nostoc sp. UHCC 0702]|nr:hypothetical protein JYQ62_31295 [Nostoc sp. UHCC 0702]